MNEGTRVALIIALIAILILVIWRAFFRKKEKFPYIKRMLFTPSELDFYRVLVKCVPPGTGLFAKVRLWDIIDVGSVPDRMAYTNKIRSKHVDFLLCDAAGEPMLIIELDDRSHERADRMERDEFVDKALLAAGIPILHVKTAQKYDERSLMKSIDEYV